MSDGPFSDVAARILNGYINLLIKIIYYIRIISSFVTLEYTLVFSGKYDF